MALAAATAEEKKLSEALKAEPSKLQEEINPTYVYLKQKLADASTQIATLTAEVNYLEGKTKELRATINDLSVEVLKIEAAEATFDNEISVLTNNLRTLAAKLQEARLAKEEQGGTIQIVESPIVPQVAVGPRRSQIFLPTGVIGLGVGTVLALLVHYVQNGTLKAGAAPAARKEN